MFRSICAQKLIITFFTSNANIKKYIYIRKIDKKENKRKKRKQIPSKLIPMKREKKRKKKNMISIIEEIQNILTLMKCVCIICFTSKHTIYLHKCVHAYKSAIYVCWLQFDLTFDLFTYTNTTYTSWFRVIRFVFQTK